MKVKRSVQVKIVFISKCDSCKKAPVDQEPETMTMEGKSLSDVINKFESEFPWNMALGAKIKDQLITFK